MLKTYAKNLTLQLCTIAAGYIFQLVYVLKFNNEVFGAYIYIISCAGVLTVALSFGIDLKLLRNISIIKSKQLQFVRMNTSLGSLLFILTIVAILCMLTWLLSDLVNKEFIYIFILASMMCILRIIEVFNIGIGKSLSSSQIQLYRNMLRIIVLILLPFTINSGALLATIVIGVELILSLCIQYVQLYSNAYFIKLKALEYRISRSALSFQLYANSLVENLYPYADKILIGLYLGFLPLGQYKITESLAVLITFSITPFMFLWRNFSKTEIGDKKIERIYRDALIVIILVASGICIAIYNIYPIYFDSFNISNKTDFELVLLIISCAYFVDAAVGPANSLLMLGGKPKITLYNNLFYNIAYFIALPYLINNWSMVGAAFAKLVLNFGVGLTNVFFIWKSLKIKVFSIGYCLLVLILSIYLGLLVYFVDNSAIFQVSFTLAVVESLPMILGIVLFLRGGRFVKHSYL